MLPAVHKAVGRNEARILFTAAGSKVAGVSWRGTKSVAVMNRGH